MEIGKDCTFVIESDSECVLDTEYELQVVARVNLDSWKRDTGWAYARENELQYMRSR